MHVRTYVRMQLHANTQQLVYVYQRMLLQHRYPHTYVRCMVIAQPLVSHARVLGLERKSAT